MTAAPRAEGARSARPPRDNGLVGDDFTYAEVGATESGRHPQGFSRLQVRMQVGEGGSDFRRAARAVLEWRMHRAMGVQMDTGAESVSVGAPVVVGLGAGRLRLRAPCRVVWTADGERRAGWGYGTLPGHPECGEESFVVSRGDSEAVWLTVTAFSRPAVWWARAAGPLVPVLQRAYARRCGAVLRRLVRRERARAEG